MAQTDLISFTHKELAEILIKQQNIHEGLWEAGVEFGLGAGNAGADDNNMLPTAFIPVLKYVLNRVKKVTNLTVDASEVNPK